MNFIFLRLRSLKIQIHMKKLLGVVLVLFVIISCNDDKQLNPEIAAIPVEITVDRFDRLFANATPAQIPELKQKYPYLFPKRYDNAFWEAKLNDTLQKELEREVEKVFANTEELENELELLYKHMIHYFPGTKIPKTTGIVSRVDYKSKVVYADSLLLIGLDNYLGEDHYFYDGIPRYYVKNHRKEQIDVDIAAAFANQYVTKPQSFSFLNQIVYEGKQLYLMELLLSQKDTHEIFSYTAEELSFAKENEVKIWEYFVSNKILYSTDRKLLQRFVDPAPFSKFYLDFDNETPGRLGRYIGYKIVSSYMSNNNTPLSAMLLQDGETIFNNAKYKP